MEQKHKTASMEGTAQSQNVTPHMLETPFYIMLHKNVLLSG